MIERTKFTVQEVAERFGVSIDTVRAWIGGGELTAINVAARRGVKARYRIDLRDIEAFERRREVPKPYRVVRRKRIDEGMKKYV